MTNFSDLPFELRYKIFEINRKEAFQSKIIAFSRLFDALSVPIIYEGGLGDNRYMSYCLIDHKLHLIIYVSQECINYFYRNGKTQDRYYIEWNKINNLWKGPTITLWINGQLSRN